tara:strand:- start:1352 stop:1486 length:135 start_codon:yes stop_codon:yes gene_type:complete
LGEFLQNADYIFEQLESQARVDELVSLLLKPNHPEEENTSLKPQ